MRLKRYFGIFLCIFALLLVVSCGESEPEAVALPVSYELSGGQNPSGAPTEVLQSEVSALLSVTPTREHYTFGGWYADAALTSPLSVSSQFTESVKLYAKWTPREYKLSFVLNGGKCESLPNTYIYGESLGLDALDPEKKYYDFVGWFTDAELTEPLSDTLSGDIVLYAGWTPESYGIDYELDGGECEGLPDEYAYGIGMDISGFVPEKTGYRFEGWYFDEFFSEEGSVIEDNFSGDIVFYAKWTRLPEAISEIPDVKKGYFGGGGNLREITLSDYVDSHGLDVTYTASSDSETVIPTVSGDLLTLEFMKGSGTAEITVSASVDGEACLSLSFSATARTYRKIACVGDSLTSGGAGYENICYPTLLAELLGEGYEVGNFGAGGTSVTEFANTTEGDYAYSSYMTYGDYYSSSLAFDADLVIIMLGTNDTKKWDRASAVYKRDYLTLINSYKERNPDVEIVISTSPEVLENNSLGIPVGVISEYIYPLQLEIAREVGATVVDFHALFESYSEAQKGFLYRDDGVHLTESAGLELAALIKKTV